MASVNGATCAMCIKSPAMLAECSPGDYQQRTWRFKIKRPFNLKIDIDQKGCSCLQSAGPRGVVLNSLWNKHRCRAARPWHYGFTGAKHDIDSNIISVFRRSCSLDRDRGRQRRNVAGEADPR